MLNFVGNNEINLIIMRIINCLKAAVLAVLVGSSLWSCSGDKGKTRYVPVVLDGEEKWSILDTKTGDVLCQNDFDEMPSVVEDGMFVVRTKSGYYECYKIDDSKNAIGKGKYTQLGTFGDEDVTFAVKEGQGIMIVNKKFEEVKKLPKKVSRTSGFSEGLAAFCKDGKWGFLDTKGEEVIPAKYDQATPFSDGRAFVLMLKNEKILIIDKKGETIKSMSLDKYNPIAFYHNGYAPIAKGDKVVFLDKNGEETFTNSKMESDGCYEINDGKTVFRRDDRYGLISTDGEVLVRPKYLSLEYANKNRYIACNDDFKFGVIDAKGDVVIDFEYSGLKQTSVVADRYFAKDGNSWVLINEKGEEQTKDSYKELNLAGSYVDVFYSEVAEEPVFEPEPDDYSVDTAVVEEVAEAY